MVIDTPTTWIDRHTRPYRTSPMTANVSACQHDSSQEQLLIYIIALVQKWNTWKQIYTSVHQLYRTTGNKRALQENEDQ